MEEKNKDLKENKKEEKKVDSKVDKKIAKKDEPKFQKVDKKEAEKVEKQAKKKENNKGTKKTPWIPTVIVVIVVLLIATLLTVMIITSSAPKKSLDSLLTNLKTGDFEKAQEYLSGEINNLGLDEDSQKLLFDKLEWRIDKVTETDESTATIDVEITTRNIQSIINDYVQEKLDAVRGAITGGENNESVSSQDFKEFFVEQLKNEDTQTTTINTTVNAVKENGNWKIVYDEKLENAILPGLEEAISTLES